jgi:hypothetical protein
MSIRKSILCVVGLVLCASLALAESVRVKSTNVNLRSAPMSTAKIVGKIAHGKILEVIEVSGMWTRVTDGRMTGWVNSALVERVAEAPAATSASETRSSGSAASSSSQPARRAPVRRAAAASEEKPFNIGAAVNLHNNSLGIGFGGRALFTPMKSKPEFRIQGIFDLYPKTGTPWSLNGNVLYLFRQVNPDLQPYTGAGVIYSHASVNGFSASSTNIDIIGGVTYKQRFFADVRIVLADGTPLALSAGIMF